MANKVYASPGVYTSEKDITFTTENVGVTTLGLVGETKKGPAFQPIFIRNYDEFKLTFGGTSPEKFKNTQIIKYELPYIAKSYLTQSNQLFVTRVLGLSGYNAGMAYVLRTLGTCDKNTLEYTDSTYDFNFTVTVTGATPGNFVVSGTSTEVIDHIASLTGVSTEKFESAYYRFFTINNYTSTDWYKNNVMYWGLLDETEQADLIVDRNSENKTVGAPATPSFIDSYELAIGVPTSDRTDDILIKEFALNTLTDEYECSSFALFAYDITGLTASVFTGKIRLVKYDYVCSPNKKSHKKVVATLRSRAQYISDDLNFSVDPETVQLTQFDSALVNPFADFEITGSTTGGTNFTYSVSLDKNKKNYIKNVLGSSSSDRDTFMFVEEVYDSILRKGWNFNEIKGLSQEIVATNEWDHYNFQYQSPSTPFFVSELRGGLPQRLFRLISISDGSNANTDVKISIANVDLSKKTFDLYVRSFNDSDKNPVLLERYLTLSMDESQDNFIGRRLGTIDNKYELRSSYVIVDIAENAPKDGVPAGFEGYEFRNNGTGDTQADFCGTPEVFYKTKYYLPGDVIVNPPFSLPVISTGDKVRKAYLGFTDLEYGYDSDLLSFKGKVSISGDNAYNDGIDWSTKTKGFHLDVNAGDIVDTNGNKVFEAGIGTFVDASVIATTTSHPYHDIKTRKFTALLSGGFDGWDIYRDVRTNTDEYRIGRTGFISGNFDTFTSVEYDELFGTSDYYATLYGIKTFENPDQTVINILATPGIDIINNTELVRETIDIVEDKRLDTIYLPTLPDIKLINNNNPANTEDWLYPNDIIDELENTEIDSNYTAVYYPWIQISDTENNANLFIPPTAEVVKNLAFTDNVAHPWFATAGYNRGVVNSKRTRITLNPESRDLLYPGRINPIATFSDVGNVIWGNRNLQTKDSALNRLNIRRLLLQARRLIISVSNRLLFDPNDAQLRSQFLSLVNPILDNIRKERGLTDFRVTLVSENENDDRNKLTGKIFIKPTPTLEFIELEFVVTPTSVSFDNI